MKKLITTDIPPQTSHHIPESGHRLDFAESNYSEVEGDRLLAAHRSHEASTPRLRCRGREVYRLGDLRGYFPLVSLAEVAFSNQSVFINVNVLGM